MAQDDVIDLDPLIASMLSKSSAQAATTATVPQVSSQQMGSSFYDLYPLIGTGQAATPSDILGPEDDFLLGATPKSTAQLTKEAGILNEGIPTGLRFDLSTTTLFNEELQKKNVEYNLRRYFEKEGVITEDDNYDFGLRVGNISGRLEFKDPRFNGKYNVLDPFDPKDVLGDIADISVDALIPIAAEVTAGIGSAMIPGVGQVPLTPILAASTAAFAASLGRLTYAKSQGFLPPDIPENAIIMQAIKEGAFSGALGITGAVAFKAIKPGLRAMGVASPKFALDIDEATFIKAYDEYMASPAGQKATELDILPSSAQVLEAAAKTTKKGGDRIAMQASAVELAEQEASIAKSPARETADALLRPSLQRTAAADEAIRAEAAIEPAMPPGVRGISPRLNVADRAAMGSDIQNIAAERAATKTAALEADVSQQLVNVEAAIDDALNLPPMLRGGRDLGSAAQDAIGEAFETASSRIGKEYENLFQRWSEATGVSIDSVIPGKGAIRPTEAVRFAQDLKATLPDRPFADPGDAAVVNKVLDSFVESSSGAAVKIKPISLRTLNENIRDLRRLERKAYLAAQRGEAAPSPETISGMVDALETARNRIISRKGAPEGLVEELKVLDDSFAKFATQFRNVQKSAVAKLRTAKNPEAAWSLLFQKDSRGATAVLEIADTLNTPANRDLFNDVGARIRKEWSDTVVTRDPRTNEIVRIDVAKHNRFIKEYGAAMDAYLTPAERSLLGDASAFANQVAEIQANKKVVSDKIRTQLNLGGGKEIEPELIFENTWRNDRFTKFDEVYSTLRQSPELMDTFKAFVYKDMFDPAAQRVKTVNGRQVLDPAQMRIYVNANEAKMKTLFGADYVQNLRTVLDATEAALTEVPKRGARTESNLLTGIIRGYVGMFTRPGRFLTAFNRVRGQAKEDALTSALADPRIMAEAAKAAKKPQLQKEFEKTIGRILLGRYDDPTNEDLPVDRPTAARALLQELEAGNR